MQKKLIALAVAGLASSAAFAQSNVTISGNIDVGYRSTTFQTGTVMDAKTAALHNGSSTSSIVFSGKEDIGGGMTVGFVLNTEPAIGASNTSLFNSENYLELAGSFGSLKAGTVNNTSLAIGAAYAQPFGTAIGGGYSLAFGRLSRTTTLSNSTAGSTSVAAIPAEGEIAGSSGAFLVRTNNSLKYTSPDLSGFKLGVQYAAKNSDTTVGAATSQTSSVLELSATYNNGPLNVGYANFQATQGNQAATGTTGPLGAVGLGTLAANEKVTQNLIGANYTFGPATVYGGWTSSKSTGAAAGTLADSRSWNIALKYAVTGTLSLAGNIVRVDDKLVGNQDRSLTGLGADYALSKRSTAYFRYETGDNDKSNGATGNFTRWGVGVRHTF